MIDVAVIGAGPAGLASAAAILQVLGTKTTVQVCLSCTSLSVTPSRRLLHLTHNDMHSLLTTPRQMLPLMLLTTLAAQ